eukprot:gene31718-38331_t
MIRLISVAHKSAFRGCQGRQGGLGLGRYSPMSSQVDPSVTPSSTPTVQTNSTKSPSKLKSILELSKFRLSSLVVLTTSAGFLAAGFPVDLLTLSTASVGTALCAASASTFNQVIEVDNDRLMKRTAQRPLPSGKLSLGFAKQWGVLTGLGGVGLLYATTSPLVAALGAGNILLYAGLYTYSKRFSEINTWIGSIVGAVPPLMGWLAATHPLTLPSSTPSTHPLTTLVQSDPLHFPALTEGLGVGWEGWGGFVCGEPIFLSTLLLLWQFPHFFALCYMYKDDYKRGGFKMVSTADDFAGVGSASQRVADLTLRYSVYLALVPPVSSYLGYTSYMYTVEATALNAYLLYLCAKFHNKQSQGNARRIFLTSLWYLPLILVGFIFHSRIYNIQGEALEEDAEGVKLVANATKGGDLVWGEDALLKAKQYMKSICMHEQMHEKDHLCAKITTEKALENAGKKVEGVVDGVVEGVATTTSHNQQNRE